MKLRKVKLAKSLYQCQGPFYYYEVDGKYGGARDLHPMVINGFIYNIRKLFNP